jgi:hypothetical protein
MFCSMPYFVYNIETKEQYKCYKRGENFVEREILLIPAFVGVITNKGRENDLHTLYNGGEIAALVPRS